MCVAPFTLPEIEQDDRQFAGIGQQHILKRLCAARILFLVRYPGRNEHQVAGSGRTEVLQLIAPADHDLAAEDAEDAFERAVMMRRLAAARCQYKRMSSERIDARWRMGECRDAVCSKTLGVTRIDGIAA